MRHPKESYFAATFRSLCTSFASMVGILLGIALVLFIFLFLSPPSYVPEETELVIAPDAEGKRELLPASAPAILRINFHGVIGESRLDSDTLDDVLLDSRTGMLKDDRVKGILLHMNTPGGTATDADNIYRALKDYKEKYKVPIYAFVNGLCASGGVYISSAADRIYATPSSVIGSVGVILGPTFNFSGTMDKIGVQSLTIAQGKDKDSLNPFRPWKPGEEIPLRDITASLYDRFVTVVTQARPTLSRDKLVQDYGARIYIASQAKEYGFIDEDNATYAQALTDLAHTAGIKEKQAYQVFELKPKVGLFSELAQSKLSFLNGKVTHTFQIGPNLSSEMSGKFLYLYSPMQ